MDSERLRREIERHDPDLPVDRAWTPPASWYLDPELFALERRAVFGASWLVAGRAAHVQTPGSYLAGWAGGEPFVITRDRQGTLRAFYNVCRHHAAIIATGAGCADALVCPYHGWRYDLDGTLRKAPRLGAIGDFDVSRHGLLPMDVAEWQGLALIHMGTPRTRPEHDFAELGRRLDAMNTAALRHVAHRSYDLACNWKVFVDNYLDGGYHVAGAHPGLAAQLDLQRYRTELFERYSIQSCPGADQATSDAGQGDAALRGRIGQQALYAWLYPNFMINRYGPAMDTNLVIPLSVGRTRVVFDFYFDRELSADFISLSLASADATQAEDIAICESVQRGLGSRAYDRGRLAPALELGEHHFHGLLARDLRRAVESLESATPATSATIE
jgi:choline monooxygenase